MRRISNSEIQTWKDCKRKWYLQYRRRLVLRREEPTGPAAVGTRIHACLARHYEMVPPDEFRLLTPLQYHDLIVEQDLATFPEREEKIRKEADLSRAMLEGYFEWVEETGADEGLVAVAPEQKLEYELMPDVTLQGRIDVRFRREEDGARMVLDHKSVQDFGTPTKMLPLDEQMKTYMLLERLQGGSERTDGAIYNMLRKVKRTASARPPFYDRVEIRHNDEVLREFYDRVLNEVCDILEAESVDPSRLYPSPSRDCTWKCQFFGVCPMMDDPTVNAEQMIDILYEEGDPYARYETNTE